MNRGVTYKYRNMFYRAKEIEDIRCISLHNTYLTKDKRGTFDVLCVTDCNIVKLCIIAEMIVCETEKIKNCFFG